ncbi:MAG: transcription termination factor NusA [Ardenticatenaceae bacterium]|nr:transcription termination factor NusA [Ardenticatenaceae bacterium]HBY98394.1 hypothetical protein [Chloroflexota bacterium]
MRSSEFMMALNALCHDRELPKEVVIEAVEAALVTAYRRDFGGAANISVRLEPTTGQAQVFAEKEVVEEVKDERGQISLVEATQLSKEVTPQVGDVIRVEMTPKDFGRIAAQTAKQVILQRIREAERDKLYTDFAGREGEIVMGTISSVDSKTSAVRLSLGKAEALLPRSEQLPNERYKVGQRVRAYVFEVSRSNRGPQITVSRTHRQMLRRLLELEVPEIANGTVEIKAIAREAGARSKVAVAALQLGIDPVGACVGMKGTRIQSIVNELNGEKIDVVQWSPDEATFVANSLSPAKVIEVYLEEGNREGKTAVVVVPDKQLSLAIGKEGQNARLAAKLTGWRIDIKSATEAAEESVRRAERAARRQAEEEARVRDEASRLAAARALLAEAEAAADESEENLEEELDALSADEALLAEARALLQSAQAEREPEPAESEAEPVEAAAEAEKVAEVEAASELEVEEVPAPAPQTPQPAPPPAAPVTRPEAVTAEEPVVEEEEEEPLPRQTKKMIFYTLDERGQPQDFGEQMERKRKKQKKKGSVKTESARERESYEERRKPAKKSRRPRGTDKWGEGVD